MVPRKVVELAFRRIMILAIPVVAVPALVLLLQDKTAEYRSSAVVWIGDSPGEQSLGHYNGYLTPAQNQVNALNDLLTTEAFRGAIAADAGIAPEEGQAISTIAPGTVVAYATGVNLLLISATTRTPEAAQRIVEATIAQYNERAASETNREATLADEYYRQQLEVAERELDLRRASVDEYLRSHPSAATPGTSASLSFDYQALVNQAEEQAQVVADLRNNLQDVQLKRVSAPQNQRAAFSVQDEPRVPAAAIPLSTTERIGYPIAGLLLGAFLAACYLYVLYRTDHTVLSGEDLQGLDVPLLGRVPLIAKHSTFGSLPGIGRFSRSHRDFARHTASAISTEAQQRA